MAIKTGSFLKHAGGDSVLYFDGKNWISCQCEGCAIAQGLIIPALRLSTADYPALSRRIGYNFTILHNRDIHNTWIKEGKPYKKL